MFGGKVKDNAMGWVGEKGGARFGGLENTGFAFDTEVVIQVGFGGDIADEGF